MCVVFMFGSKIKFSLVSIKYLIIDYVSVIKLSCFSYFQAAESERFSLPFSRRCLKEFI